MSINSITEKCIFSLARDALKNYDYDKKISVYEEIINLGGTQTLLKQFPEFIDDISNHKELGLRVITNFIDLKIVAYTEITERVCKLIINLINNNLIPKLFIQSIKFHEYFIQVMTRHNLSYVANLVKSEQITLNSVFYDIDKKCIYESIKRNITNSFLEEFAEFLELSTENMYSLLSDNPNLINKIKINEFEELFSLISQNQTSFDKTINDRLNTKYKLNYQIFLMALVHNTDETFIINCYKNIEKKIKIKMLLSFSDTKEYFFNNFKNISNRIIKILCENKGTTIVYVYFERLLEDNFEENIKDVNFCLNLITLINECQITILELIDAGEIMRDTIINKIKQTINLHSNIAKKINLQVISMLNLHNVIITEEEEIKLLFTTLQNYVFSDENSTLSSIDVHLVKKLLENDDYFPFLDLNIVINFLSEFYRENINNHHKLTEIKSMIYELSPKLNTYNPSDVAPIIKKLIRSNDITIAEEFIDLYFDIAPLVKNKIIEHLRKYIKLEASLIEKIDNDYELNNPLIQIYDFLSSGSLNKKTNNKQLDDKPKNKLFDFAIDENLITGQKLKELFNTNGCEKFKSDAIICQICLENTVDTVFNPCGHVLCSECLNSLPKSTARKCHVCSAKNVVPIRMYIV